MAFDLSDVRRGHGHRGDTSLFFPRSIFDNRSARMNWDKRKKHDDWRVRWIKLQILNMSQIWVKKTKKQTNKRKWTIADFFYNLPAFENFLTCQRVWMTFNSNNRYFNDAQFAFFISYRILILIILHKKILLIVIHIWNNLLRWKKKFKEIRGMH